MTADTDDDMQMWDVLYWNETIMEDELDWNALLYWEQWKYFDFAAGEDAKKTHSASLQVCI